MFDVGFWELLIIFGLGLVFLGPERLPRVAGQIGRWVGRARRTANQLRRQLEQEINLDEQKTYRRPPPPPPPQTRSEEPDEGTDAEVTSQPSSDGETQTANEH